MAAIIGGDPNGTGGFPDSGLTQGIFAGGHVGFTTQWGSIIVGAEASFNLTNVDGQIQCGNGGLYGYICNTGLRSLTTITGRIGYGVGQSQPYLTAGLAWGRHSLEINEPFFAYFVNPLGYSWGAADESHLGWTVGFGVERTLSHGVSLRADYSYVRFPTRDVVLTNSIWPDTTVTVAQDYHFASIGFNYRFGQGEDGQMMAWAPADGPGGNDAGWEVEFGKRAWLNFGSYRFDLFDPFAPTSQISRITYAGSIGLAGESFLRAETASGFFVNALFGTGISSHGTMVDEDFSPYVVPYSVAEAEFQGGRLTYGGVDFGCALVNRPRAAAGVFIGVTAMLERYQAFGCTQVATNFVCVPSVPDNYEVITQTSIWTAFRLGVVGAADIAERLELRGEAAIQPLAFLWAYDNHWLRPGINPLPEFGRGYGVQLEASLAYALTEQFSLGIGGRFWTVKANGAAEFPGISEPQTTTSRHYGVFLEAILALGN